MDALNRSLIKILSRKPPATVAIFSRNDSYRCYRADAILVAQEIFLSDVGLRKFYIGDEEITYIILNAAQYARVIRDVLLRLRYRAEVYEEKDSQYVLKSKGVLGNLGDFEELVADSIDLSELSTIMCVRLDGDDNAEENRVLASFCNGQALKLTVTEFQDTPHFSLLEQCIVSMTPRECVLVSKDSQQCPNRWKRLETALNRSGVQRTVVAETCEDRDACKAQVVKLLSGSHKDANLPSLQWAALKALADSMQLHEDDKYQDAFVLQGFASAGYMHLDTAALKALEVFDTTDDADASSGDATLYTFLDKCRSGQGRRLLREWLRRPLCDARQIEERLNVVESLVNDHSTRQTLHDDLLRRVPDVTVLTRKLVAGRGTLQDCYRLYQLIRLLRRFEATLLGLSAVDERLAPSVKELVLEPIQLSILEFDRFMALVESSVDVEYGESTGQFRIKPEVDKDLLEISKQIDQLDSRAQKALSKVSDRLGSDGIKLDSNIELGFYFRTPLKNEKNIRDAGVKVIDSTKGGGFRFHTKELDGLNTEYRDLLQSYETGQAHLTKLVVSTCAGYVPALQNLSEKIGLLDVLTSFSVVATSASNGYVRPEILPKGSGVLQLVQCRHPVVERSSDVQYIPNDVKLDKESGRFVVLTGANMGGKSTYLRSAGITVLMGQIGSFVPCESARFSLVDGIFTRVGAGDFQATGISTFMAEMVDCATILETATADSLIIIDELGRGTSTYDGFGLAWAIAEDIITRIKCFSLFATHFHEMAQMKQQYADVVRTLKVDTYVNEAGALTILYQVKEGVAEKSFGIDVARLVGFPKEIIEDADSRLAVLESQQRGNSHDNGMEVDAST